MNTTTKLLLEIRKCNICENVLPYGANPVIEFSKNSKILIVGQAPGIKVHKTNIPWNDASGDKLRNWMNIDKQIFYNPQNISIVPMGFCYPGKGLKGDMPPIKQCANTWRDKIHKEIPNIELTLLIGQYAQNYYLNTDDKTVTETIKNFEKHLKNGFFPLIHPSPRNTPWHKKNPWFENEIIPILRQNISSILIKKEI